jgi:hypothetical protein
MSGRDGQNLEGSFQLLAPSDSNFNRESNRNFNENFNDSPG